MSAVNVTTPATQGTYEPPVSAEDTPLVPGDEPVIAPGVRGYAVRVGERIYVPMIIAEREGSGDVGRFLDALSPRCVIPSVISRRLVGMLRRRGWRPTTELSYGEEHEVWVHPMAGAAR